VKLTATSEAGKRGPWTSAAEISLQVNFNSLSDPRPT